MNSVIEGMALNNKLALGFAYLILFLVKRERMQDLNKEEATHLTTRSHMKNSSLMTRVIPLLTSISIFSPFE